MSSGMNMAALGRVMPMEGALLSWIHRHRKAKQGGDAHPSHEHFRSG